MGSVSCTGSIFSDKWKSGTLTKEDMDVCVIKHGKINDIDELSGESLLHYAVNQDDSELIRYLISSGGDVDVHDRYQVDPPLILALRQYRFESLTELLKHKPSMNVRSKEGVHVTAFIPFYFIFKEVMGDQGSESVLDYGNHLRRIQDKQESAMNLSQNCGNAPAYFYTHKCFGFAPYDVEVHYLGEWDKGKYNGYGVLHWKYDGQYADIRQNHSTYHLKNHFPKIFYEVDFPVGFSYFGEWKDGKMDGEGVSFSPNKDGGFDVKKGLWKSGYFVR